MGLHISQHQIKQTKHKIEITNGQSLIEFHKYSTLIR